MLSQAGYVTAAIGKWHLGQQGWWAEDHGFQFSVGGSHAGSHGSMFPPYWPAAKIQRLGWRPFPDARPGEYLTDRITREAEAFLDRHGDQPFFLYLSHYAVHTRIEGKPELVEKYRKKRPGGSQKNPEYAAMVEGLDQSVGAVVAKLEEVGVAERTVFVFFSDNGGLSKDGRITSNLPLRGEKNAYFLGEHFFEATKWLQGDQEDGAMNYYGFGMPIRAFLAGKDHREHPVYIDAQDLDEMLTRARARIPFAHQLSQFNLLDSHDTARFLTAAKGDKDLFKIAVTALFTYIGVPCVYYGDEVGLGGEHDPDCRRTFPWDEADWDKDIHHHYKTLIALRKQSETLQKGAYMPLYAQGDVFAFARVLGNDVIITVLNRGNACEIDLPIWQTGAERSFSSLFNSERVTSKDGVLRLELEASASYILTSTNP